VGGLPDKQGVDVATARAGTGPPPRATPASNRRRRLPCSFAGGQRGSSSRLPVAWSRRRSLRWSSIA